MALRALKAEAESKAG